MVERYKECMKHWQQVIQNDFEFRKSKTYSYSLRRYATFLELSPAQLSQLISGKRALSKKMAGKICEKLTLSPFEKEKFVLSALSSTQDISSSESHVQLADDEFALIADWYHFAILSLSETRHTKASALWISKRLGIDHGKAREALERLERLGILELKNGKLKQLKKNIRTTSDIPSAAIRKYHRQNLQLASDKIETIKPEAREFTAITMSINPKKLKDAKKMINDFKRKLCDLLQDGEPSEVYTFSAQLFPVSITKDEV